MDRNLCATMSLSENRNQHQLEMQTVRKHVTAHTRIQDAAECISTVALYSMNGHPVWLHVTAARGDNHENFLATYVLP